MRIPIFQYGSNLNQEIEPNSPSQFVEIRSPAESVSSSSEASSIVTFEETAQQGSSVSVNVLFSEITGQVARLFEEITLEIPQNWTLPEILGETLDIETFTEKDLDFLSSVLRDLQVHQLDSWWFQAASDFFFYLLIAKEKRKVNLETRC